MFKNNNKKRAFTFVELIVALILSSIIFLFLMNFIAKTFEEMNYSKNKTTIISQIYDFQDTIEDLREKYNSWTILVDNDEWTWSDILLFRTSSWTIKEKWIIIAMVSNDTLFIDWANNVDNIGDKVLAYKKLSSQELNTLSSNINNIYDFKFNRDKTFKDIKLKDFQVEKYDSWSLFETRFFINPIYKKKMNSQKYSEIWTDKIEEVVLDF